MSIAAQRFGVTSLQENQQLVIDVVLSDRDARVLMPADGGGPSDAALTHCFYHKLFRLSPNDMKENKLLHAVFIVKWVACSAACMLVVLDTRSCCSKPGPKPLRNLGQLDACQQAILKAGLSQQCVMQ